MNVRGPHLASLYQPAEWTVTADNIVADIAPSVEVTGLFTDPSGRHWGIPGFWAGGDRWKVRFSPRSTGIYRLRTECVDVPSLQTEVQFQCEAQPGRGLPAVEVSPGGGFRMADGRPFMWVGDTWWMALCGRLTLAELRELAADRAGKGFTVVQIVAGLFPDMPPFDERGADDGEFPWTPGLERLNPRFFDRADERIKIIVDAGLVPCVVGAWGYYLRHLGVAKTKAHWRNLIARWGAYSVIWCVAGETTMPWYLAGRDGRSHAAEQKAGWSEVARYVRAIDPYRHPITTHPCGGSRGTAEVEDPSLLTFDMLQGAQGPYPAAIASAGQLLAGIDARPSPSMPVVLGEASYEGILGAGPDAQRLLFWASALSGAGYTYGANGVWQVNRSGAPFGPSPHGGSWGDVTWREGMDAPGSAQIAVGLVLLRRYEWWRFEPHPDWLTLPARPGRPDGAYAAGIPGQCRLIYVPVPRHGFPPLRRLQWKLWVRRLAVRNLEADVAYRAFWFDPIDGAEHPLPDPVVGVRDQEWRLPRPPTERDWVLVLERTR